MNFLDNCPWLLLLVVCIGMAPLEARRKGGPRKQAQRCEQNRQVCSNNAVCINTRRSFRCKCQPGYIGDGKTCTDEDECSYKNGGCVHTCINTPGNYTCGCKPGFQLKDDGKDCEDINECFDRKGGCSHQCINTLGNFECRCNSGYSIDKTGRKCVFGEWCKIKLDCEHGCKPSTMGNYVDCFCRDGYTLQADRKSCVRSCKLGNGGCQHVCNDTVSGPVCSCADNYILNEDSRTCTASCAVHNGGCERKCSDTPQGPTCSCPDGYKLHLDGKSCLDIDECVMKVDGCSHTCENTRGSFECVCPEGYKVGMDDKNCIDIDECRLNTTCDHECENTPGSFNCHCTTGYQEYGKTHCGDVNECLVHGGGCSYSCTNKKGGYTCSCAPGYKLHPNGHECVESKQCHPLVQHANAQLTCTTAWPHEQRCTLQCPGQGRIVGPGGLLSVSSLTFSCGASTGYNWTNLPNGSLPMCAASLRAPSFARRARFLFVYDSCSIDSRDIETMRQNLTLILNSEKKYRCVKKCQVNSLDLMCGSKRKKFHKLIRRKKKVLITAEFDLVLNSKRVKGDKCDVDCSAKRTARRFNRVFKKLKRTVRRNKLILRLGKSEVRAVKKSLKYDRKSHRSLCMEGMELRGGVCIGCLVGTYFSRDRGTCQACPRGTYQDEEATVKCKACPDSLPGSGVEGATSEAQCSELCEPGTISSTGKKPCQPCQVGTYQPYFGRISCMPCGHRLRTASVGSDGFEDCLAQVSCEPGNFYNQSTGTCQVCARGTYQPRTGQDFCYTCPAKTNTDFPASVSANDCKDRRCGNFMGEHFGILQSPNYPGNYPVDIECVWKIRPEKRRRILIIIPDIALMDQDKCGDILSMRKSKSVYSQSTYETCESRHRPIAFTARSKKLWIQFKSNGNNTAGGFSIPFVLYNEEYESLIEDIVRDGRLYSSNQHQQIFKDRELLTALLEVIATPYSYLKYANVSHTMFPRSFFKLLVPKVRRFFET